jgi:ABC-type phosphate transport system substrate-binding protein
MSRFKSYLVAGATALAAASTLGGVANAQTFVNGAGSTLLAPYWAQAVGCWDPSAQASPSIYQNGKFAKVPATSGTTDTIATPAAVTGCVLPANNNFIAFVASGSGAGQAVLFAHDARQDLLGDNTDGSHTEPFTGLQYALSDNSMANNDVGVYSVGTATSYTPPDGSGAFTTTSTYVGKQFTPTQTVSLTFGGSAGPNNYAVPKTLYGPLVQIPVSIDAVAIAFNPQYSATSGVHNLNIVTAGKKLNLDSATYCAIFTGGITDWGDGALTALNVNPTTHVATPLVAPADVGNSPINSSGTTSIFTRHLAAVCGGIYTGGTTTLPAGSPFADLKSGSSGVAGEVHAHAGYMGYVGIDYVAPFSKKSGATGTGGSYFALPAAKLKNNFGNFELPTPGTATAAFAGITAPVGMLARSDQTQWAQSPAKTVSLAKPTGKTAYPIVGTTQFLAYSCYASSDTLTDVRSFFTFLNSAKGSAILKAAGLAPMPGSWKTAITQTFLTPTATTKTYNLFLAHAGDGADGQGNTNANCTAGGIIGG